MGHRTWSDESTERHISNYDGEGVWRLEAYDSQSAGILRSVGATETKRHGAGVTFECTPLQLIHYIAALHGIDVETGKKRRQLSDEEKERRRQRMAAARSKIGA